jgi:hypothetical protein
VLVIVPVSQKKNETQHTARRQRTTTTMIDATIVFVAFELPLVDEFVLL